MQREQFRRIKNTVRSAIDQLQGEGAVRISADSILTWAGSDYDLTTDVVNKALLAIADESNPVLRPVFSVRCVGEDPPCNRVRELDYASFDELHAAEDDCCDRCGSPLPVDGNHVWVGFVIDHTKYLKKKTLAL